MACAQRASTEADGSSYEAPTVDATQAAFDHPMRSTPAHAVVAPSINARAASVFTRGHGL